MGRIISYEEINGSAISFNSDIVKDLKKCEVAIEPIQSGSGNSSPDNIRPISGWTGIRITVNSDIYDIAFPSAAGTVYGGTLDVLTGVLAVDRIKYTFTAFEDKSSSTAVDQYLIRNLATAKTPFNLNKSRCSIASPSSSLFVDEGYAKFGVTISNTTLVRVSFPKSFGIDTIEKANELISDGFDVCYELDTPTTYQLTPQEIQTIIGTNIIYADAGNTTVYYPKTFAPIETYSNISILESRRRIITSTKAIEKNKVYGVEWNYADPSTVLKRTGAATNFANPIPAESLSEVGWSPFDNIYPWRDMKRYNIINGEVAYSQDDAGYSETLYDTMVYIPEFYYYAYKDTTNQKWDWSISAKPLEGYTKHPGSGRYVGRFHTSGSSSGVYSKGSVTPLANITRANFRTYSHNKGSNWWQIDLATWSAIQLLYLIEFANWDSQNVLGLGSNNGEYPENTGGTNGLLYHSIKRSDSANAYRSIENPFSNILIFIDGIVAYNKRIYTTTNISNYSESYSTMQNTNISLPNIGFIKNIGYSSACPFAFIPNESFDGDGSTYVSDMVESGTVYVNHMAAVGGHWNQLPKRGLFFITCANEASIMSDTLGSRLMFIPSN